MHSDGFQYKYCAFISYSHKDMSTAVELQRKLEKYHLPLEIREEYGLANLRPIFLDKTDLSVGNLNEKLCQALEKSRFLIVFCSPSSAVPNDRGMHYVDAEVSYFYEHGGEDNIIPIIVDGVRNDPEKECFCPKLCKLNPLGVDATNLPKEWDRVLNETVANLFDKEPREFNELLQREKRRLRNQRIRRFAIAALIMFVIGLVSYDLCYPPIKYYSDYVDKDGVPTGIFKPLTEAEMKSRQYHYRFVYKRQWPFFWKLVLQEVIRCNSTGTPFDLSIYPADLVHDFPDHATWQKIEFKDPQKNILDSIDLYNAHGVHLERRRFSVDNQDVIDFNYKPTNEKEFVPQPLSVLNGQNSRSEIELWRITRDKDGYPETIRFYRITKLHDEVPVRNADGCFGVAYKHDEFGRVTEQTYLDKKGERMALQNGVSSVHYVYSQAEPQLVIIKSDHQENEIERKELTYDTNGNLTSVSYYRQGQPSFDDNGYARCDFEYDDGTGNLTKCSFYDPQEKKCLNKDGVAKMEFRYDGKGRLIEYSMLDTDDNLCFSKDGYAKVTLAYDEHGNITEKAFHGLGVSDLCINKDGYAKVTMKYNHNGKIKEMTFFGADGKPCLINAGYSKVTGEYDEHGIKEESYRGPEGNDLCLSSNGYAKIEWKYKEVNNKIVRTTTYFGTNGSIHRNNDGYAKKTDMFDERGSVFEEAYFEADGETPCLSKAGYAKITWEYYEDGNLKNEVFLDVDGKTPCLSADGYAKRTWDYDENGNIKNVSFSSFDDGQHKRERYDERGFKREVSYLDSTGNPISCEDGYAVVRWEYDEHGNKSRESYFETDGKTPCLSKDGYATVEWSYDERGRMSREAYKGINGEPCSGKDGYAIIEWGYDKRGNMNAVSYRREDGYLVSISDGFAKKTMNYNKRDQKTDENYYGVDGEPCTHREGFAKIEWTYDDESGNMIEEKYLEADGRTPCLRGNLFAKIKREYDGSGRLKEETCKGINNELRMNHNGYAKKKIEYDKRSGGMTIMLYNDLEKKMEEAYFLGDGKKTRMQHGKHGDYVKVTWTYDEYGRKQEEIHQGKDGEQCERKEFVYDNLPDGVGVTTRLYDAHGNKIEEAYLESDGETPCLSEDGYAIIEWDYDDESGNVIKELFKGMNGEACLCKDGYAKRTWEYEGNTIEETFFNENGTMCERNDGIARILTEYDENGEEKSRTGYDLKGKWFHLEIEEKEESEAEEE